MKKEKVKRAAVIMLAGALSMQTAVFAGGNNEQSVNEADLAAVMNVMPRFVAITSYENDLILNSGTLNCYGLTKVSSGYKAKIMVELQKYTTSWNTIKTWTVTGTGATASVDEDYAVTSGKYRLKITHYAMSGSTAVEDYTSYSIEVTK